MTLPRRDGYTYNSISILLLWGCYFETRFEIATNASKIITVAFPFSEDSITQSQVKAAEPPITENLFCHDVIANVSFDLVSIHLRLFFSFFSFFVKYPLVGKVEIRNRKIYRQTAEREKKLGTSQRIDQRVHTVKLLNAMNQSFIVREASTPRFSLDFAASFSSHHRRPKSKTIDQREH